MKSICAALLHRQESNPQNMAMSSRRSGHWQHHTWQDYFDSVAGLASSLQELGVRAGDRAAIIANTRYEWAVSDVAIMSLGAVTVPIYPSNQVEDIEYILNDCAAKILIVENESLLKKWHAIKKQCPSITKVVIMDTRPGVEPEVLLFSDLAAADMELSEGSQQSIKQSIQSLQLDQPATILYTSGTTGKPKGVLLCHRQIMSEIKDVFSLLAIDERDTSLSFLPYSHILGRVEMWGSIYAGFHMYFAESIERIAKNILEVQPTILIAVPRIFEKIYSEILSRAEASPLKSWLFRWAKNKGSKIGELQLKNKSIPLLDIPEYLVAKKLIFNPILNKLGGRLRFAVCGGAPLSQEIAEFFYSVGVLILEGYGLTETTAAITVNTPTAMRFGTVGKPLADVKIRLADDGEILVKSEKVMAEYYNNAQATKDVLVDGYFATGDIGEWTTDGFLRITDRKKDLIKTAGGKYVAPQKLENLLKLHPLISNVLIHGDQRKYIVSLLTLNPEQVTKFAQNHNIHSKSSQELVDHPQVLAEVRRAVAHTNSQLASFETIKNYKVLPQDFTIEAGELTPSLKVKRKFCDQKYKAQIDELY